MTIKAHTQTIWICMAVLTIFAGSIYAGGEDLSTGDQRPLLTASTSGGSRILYSADQLIGSPVYSKQASVSASSASVDRNIDAIGQNAVTDSYGTSGTSTNSRDMYDTDAARDQSTLNKEKVGSVEELVINANQDDVCYVILNANGRHCPVPWYAFDVKQAKVSKNQPQLSDGQVQPGVITPNQNAYQDRTGLESGIDTGQPMLYVKLSQEQLRQAPSIDSLSSDALSDPQLKQKVDAYYSKLPGLSSHAKSYSQRMHQQGQRMTRGQSAVQDQFGTQDQSTAQSQRGTQDQSIAQSQRGTQDQPIAGRQADATGYGQAEANRQRDAVTGRQADATGYGQAEANRQKDAVTGSVAMGNLVMVSDIIGSDLQGSEDIDLGSVSDIIIDAQQGQIAYGLITFGGFLNFNQKVAAVPWSALTVSPQQGTVTIHATQDELDAVVLQGGSIDQLSDAQFAQKVHSTFDTEPYWGIYGFVPGSSDMADPNGLRKTDRDTDRDRVRDRSTDRDRDTNRRRDTNRQNTENQRNSY